MNPKRLFQNRPVLVFAIITALLAAAVIGVAYFVQQRGEQARHEQAIAATNQQAEEENGNATPTDKDKNGQTGTNGAKTTTTTPTTGTQSTPQPTNALPQTGPAEGMMSALMAGTLAAAIAAYASSRTARQQL
ncbi:MAG: hypothetical protein JWN33_679 [Candidatus Saccharibacteria bacterium]|nr:hypothetical protein [Candidatus Saccharibacteria bacterium]